MIFWGYLIRAIRNPNNACAPTPRVWIKAPCFKFWTAISVSTGLLLFGAACIEMEDLEYQRVSPFRSRTTRKLTDPVILVHRHLWYLPLVSTLDCPITCADGKTLVRIVRLRLLPTQLRHQDEGFRSRFRNARTIGCFPRDQFHQDTSPSCLCYLLRMFPFSQVESTS
jgi:hypothetical protein